MSSLPTKLPGYTLKEVHYSVVNRLYDNKELKSSRLYASFGLYYEIIVANCQKMGSYGSCTTQLMNCNSKTVRTYPFKICLRLVEVLNRGSKGVWGSGCVSVFV